MDEHYILVVDDDDAVRDTVVDVLEDANYSVRAARDGCDALNLLRTGSKPCLVLLDLMMPVMNGWDFAVESAQDPALRGIPICVITAAGSSRQFPEQAVAVLKKPIDLRLLLDIVQKHC
jgi:CheY-like chemotaxis protein